MQAFVILHTENWHVRKVPYQVTEYTELVKKIYFFTWKDAEEQMLITLPVYYLNI